jgi:hypothetical protein
MAILELTVKTVGGCIVKYDQAFVNGIVQKHCDGQSSFTARCFSRKGSLFVLNFNDAQPPPLYACKKRGSSKQSLTFSTNHLGQRHWPVFA